MVPTRKTYLDTRITLRNAFQQQTDISKDGIPVTSQCERGVKNEGNCNWRSIQCKWVGHDTTTSDEGKEQVSVTLTRIEMPPPDCLLSVHGYNSCRFEPGLNEGFVQTMAPIRTHTKSRRGCKTCRNRKVKCDETSPICSNCAKREIECIWETPNTFPTIPPSTSIVSSHTEPRPLRFMFDADSTALDFMALELMHHYTESTCYTVFHHPDMLHVWKSVIPNMAFTSSCPFLLHAILSVSALHLYHLYGSNASAAKYAYAAATYHAQAQKAAPTLPQLIPTVNPHVVFITNSFMTLYGYATCAGSVWAQSEWIQQLRCKPEEARIRYNAYQESGLAPLLNVFGRIHHAVINSLTTDMEGFPRSLATIHLPTADDPDPAELADPNVASMYEKAVVDLRRTWTASFCSDYHAYAAVSWLVNASPYFMDFLWQRRPRALILAGHYCAIMRRMNGPWWTQKDWTAEMNRIADHVGEKWRNWMDWIPPDGSGLVPFDDDNDSYSWLSSDSLVSFSSTL